MGYFDHGGFEAQYDDRECMVCHSSVMDHRYYSDQYSDGHPLITTNLEYLAWKYEQRQLQAV